MITAQDANRIANDYSKDYAPQTLTAILKDIEIQARAGQYSTAISEDTEEDVKKELELLGYKVNTVVDEVTWEDEEV